MPSALRPRHRISSKNGRVFPGPRGLGCGIPSEAHTAIIIDQRSIEAADGTLLASLTSAGRISHPWWTPREWREAASLWGWCVLGGESSESGRLVRLNADKARSPVAFVETVKSDR